MVFSNSPSDGEMGFFGRAGFLSRFVLNAFQSDFPLSMLFQINAFVYFPLLNWYACRLIVSMVPYLSKCHQRCEGCCGLWVWKRTRCSPQSQEHVRVVHVFDVTNYVFSWRLAFIRPNSPCLTTEDVACLGFEFLLFLFPCFFSPHNH